MEMGQKDCESQRIRVFTVKLCPLVMSEATLVVPMTHLPKYDLNKGNNGHAKVDKGKPVGPQPLHTERKAPKEF